MDRFVSLFRWLRRLLFFGRSAGFAFVRFMFRGGKRAAVVWYLAFGLMGTVTFTQFILEEALQQASFSCYHYKAAYKQNPSPDLVFRMEANLLRFREVQEAAEWWNTWVGWLNPFTRSAFFHYNSSSRMQLMAYESWVADKKGELGMFEQEAVEVNVGVNCPRCGGTGTYKSYGSCFRCDGTGLAVH